jgi:predicted sulfurtransferase
MVLAPNGVWYERTAPPPSNSTLLLFYAYVQPPWSPRERAQAVAFTQEALASRGCSGRLRVALEGFNGTLTGPAAGVRGFCDALRAYDARHFGSVDFKLVDGLADNKAFRSLKVWPVDELVTYGLRGAAEAEAPLSRGGTHLSPQAFEDMARSVPGAVIIDVRNANETAIGAFAPPAGGATVLDPRMRRSTEFPAWVEAHAAELRERPAVLMCE